MESILSNPWVSGIVTGVVAGLLSKVIWTAVTNSPTTVYPPQLGIADKVKVILTSIAYGAIITMLTFMFLYLYSFVMSFPSSMSTLADRLRLSTDELKLLVNVMFLVFWILFAVTIFGGLFLGHNPLSLGHWYKTLGGLAVVGLCVFIIMAFLASDFPCYKFVMDNEGSLILVNECNSLRPASAPPAPPFGATRQETVQRMRPGDAEGFWSIFLHGALSSELEARQRAEDALRKGFAEVGILYSSDYSKLRPGYWVVFTGRFADQAATEAAALHASASGYPGAYARWIGP